MKTLTWEKNTLILLDQTKLPTQEEYLQCSSWRQVEEAIKVLAVRGAPAIGVAAAYAVVLAALELKKETDFRQRLADVIITLDKARPTAVNLHWALERMNHVIQEHNDVSVETLIEALEDEAKFIHAEDVDVNKRIGRFGAKALMARIRRDKLIVLTHCNAGALATADIGTALGVIRNLHDKGQIANVFADETRPLLQGARLTATELQADKIPVTLITDNMAAWVMKTRQVDAVIVGADRITANGDTANKIGTYGVALAAKVHGIPFFVAAPISTFDLSMKSGEEIPIEERNHDEVRNIQGVQTALKNTPVFNPAFDVTPHEYITAIITQDGVIDHPDTLSIAEFFRNREE